MIYYDAIRDKSYKKLAKYMLVSQCSNINNPYLDIIDNTTMVVRDGNSIRKLKLPNFMRKIFIGLIRNPADSEIYRISLCRKDGILWCKFYINMDYLHEICLRGSVSPEILANMINQNHEKQPELKYSHTDIPIYNNGSPFIICNYGKFFKINPYDYQHNNIYWMYSTEKAISRGDHYLDYIVTSDLYTFNFKGLTYYMDPVTTILYDNDTIWASKRRKQFNIYGGVLCDKVGLGKTLSMTGLILSDKYTSITEPEPVNNVKDDDNVEADVKAKLKVKLKVKAKIRPKITSKSESESKPKPKPKPKSKSHTTLVLCPRRLVSQWITEIHKYTDYLRVIEISTLTHIKKYSYQDLKDIDVVVASFSLFDNKNYYTQNNFKLNNVHWRRVIVDEGHEVLLHKMKKSAADTRISTSIFSINSDFRWVCSGTPLPKLKESLQAVLSYLNMLGHNEHSPVLDNIDRTSYKRLMELLFHCNTQESIKSQITIPQYRTHVEMLDFTKTERAIYDSIPDYDKTRKLQVCTNLSVSDTDNDILGGHVLDLKQVTGAMGVYYMQNCDRLDKIITDNGVKIKNIEDDIDKDTEDTDNQIKYMKRKGADKEHIAEIRHDFNRRKNNARNKINTLTEQTQKAEYDLIESRKQLQLFKALDIDHITKGTCPIFGTPLKGQVAISPTGFYYSKQGVDVLFMGGRKIAKCPCSRQQIELDSLTFIDTESTDNKEDVDIERSKWGTKMACVINKLRSLFHEDPDAKIIIFSQWKKMLMLMAKALKDSSINHVFCRGNVHMMSKSIKLFKTDPKTRVILLSSESCNSGSNLTEATHVFLIDAVNGDITNAKSAETQAIARTCRIGQTREVQVYRFVIRNSIEEDYYNAINAAE